MKKILILMILGPVCAGAQEKPVPDASGYYPANSSWSYFRVTETEITGRSQPNESAPELVNLTSGHLLQGQLIKADGPSSWLKVTLEGKIFFVPAQERFLKAAESGPGVRPNGDFYRKFRDFHVYYQVEVDELNARRSAAGALDLSNERGWPLLNIFDWPVYTTYSKGQIVAAQQLVSDTREQNWFVIEGRPNRWQMLMRANSKFLKPVAGPQLRWVE